MCRSTNEEWFTAKPVTVQQNDAEIFMCKIHLVRSAQYPENQNMPNRLELQVGVESKTTNFNCLTKFIVPVQWEFAIPKSS